MKSSPNFTRHHLITHTIILTYLKLISRYLGQLPASLRKQTSSLRHSSASQLAERTRSDPAISPTRSRVTTSKPKQADKKQTCLPNLSRTSCIIMAIFHNSNYLASRWRNRLIPQFRVSSDLTSHTKAGSNPGQARNNNYLFFTSSKSNTFS